MCQPCTDLVPLVDELQAAGELQAWETRLEAPEPQAQTSYRLTLASRDAKPLQALVDSELPAPIGKLSTALRRRQWARPGELPFEPPQQTTGDVGRDAVTTPLRAAA